MSLARRARFLCKSAAFSATVAVAVLCMCLGALGLLIAAFIVWLNHFLGPAAALAIAGVVGLGIALIIMGVAGLVLRRMRARQPSLASETIGMLSFGMRMATMVIRRDPSKMMLAAIIAGAMAEYLSNSRPPKD